MDINHFLTSYWNYYLELEEHFIHTKRYVTFDIGNFKTFSIEYLKLFQAVCSEIDVVAKIIAEENNPKFKDEKNKNIQKWGYEIQQLFPTLENDKIKFSNNIIIEPWKNCKYEKVKEKKINYRLCKGKKTPKWWIDYNKVKHERTATYDGVVNYSRANLNNLSSALAALYILECHYIEYLIEKYKISTIEYEHSKIFDVKK